MATQVASLYADIGAKTDGFTKGVSSVLSGLGKTALSVGALTSALKIMSDAWDLSKEGAQMQRLADSGSEMARQLGGDMDSIVSKVKEASLGTVSEMDIIASSNKAMMLGLGADAEQLANLMEVAAFRGRAMGVSTTQAFDDIVRGIGRQSPMILDNLGIVVNAKETYDQYANNLGKTAKELTKAEKTQALLNRVLQEGNGMLEKAGGLVEDNASQYEKLTARVDDYKASLARSISEGVSPSVEAFLDYADAMDAASEATGLTDQRSRVYLGALQLQVQQEKEAIETSQRGADSRWAALASYYDTTTAINGVTEAVEMDEEAIKSMTEANRDYLSLVGDVTREYESQSDKLGDLTSEHEELLAEKQKLIDEGWWAESEKIQGVNEKIDENREKYSEATNEFELNTRRRILSMLEEQLSLDGLSAEEQEILLEKGLAWGVYSQQAVDATRAAMEEVALLTAAINTIPSERTFTMSVLVQGADAVGGLGAGYGASQWDNRTEHAAGGSFMIPSSYGNEGFAMGNGDTASGGELITISPRGQDNGTAEIVAALERNRLDENKLVRLMEGVMQRNSR